MPPSTVTSTPDASVPSAPHLDLEPVHDVLDVRAGQRLSEAQLLGEVNLVVQLMQLLHKLLLSDGAVQYHTEG